MAGKTYRIRSWDGIVKGAAVTKVMRTLIVNIARVRTCLGEMQAW